MSPTRFYHNSLMGHSRPNQYKKRTTPSDLDETRCVGNHSMVSKSPMTNFSVIQFAILMKFGKVMSRSFRPMCTSLVLIFQLLFKLCI